MKRRLSDIICQNTDRIEALPLNVFRLDNDPVPCKDRPDLDFEDFVLHFLEKPHHEIRTTPDYFIGESSSADYTEPKYQNYESTTKEYYQEESKDIYI